LLGLLVLDEQLTSTQWLAILLTMLAAAGSSFTAQRGLTQSAPAEMLM
jgi:threonine/homoserine efflux transporter RhtA